MSVADVVRRAERKINAFNTKRSLEAGWQPTVVPYIGYGDETKVRVLARVLMSNPDRGASHCGSARFPPVLHYPGG